MHNRNRPTVKPERLSAGGLTLGQFPLSCPERLEILDHAPVFAQACERACQEGHLRLDLGDSSLIEHFVNSLTYPDGSPGKGYRIRPNLFELRAMHFLH
jgi:hypothetical protein